MASGRLYSNMTALRSLTLDTGPGEMESTIPRDIVAGTGTDPRPRLLVEPDQVAFFEGRMFRIFNEFNIAAGQSAYFKFVLTGDIIVTSRELVVVEGRIRASTILGGTEAGTWTAYTVGRQNNMASQPQPPYTAGTTVFTGGSVSGGTVGDIRLLETTNQNATVQSYSRTVGLPAGTVYVKLENTGTGALRGVYTLVWEEVKPLSNKIY